MREFDVAWSQSIAGFLGKCDVEEEIVGKANPSIEPAKGSFNPPGLLVVSYRLPGSYGEAEDSVRA